MSKLTLKEILKREDIRKNIKNDLLLKDEEVKTAIEKTIESEKNNSTSIEFLRDNSTVVEFENTLYVDKNKQIYLLESRVFDKEKDQMVNAYLEVLNQDGEITEEYIDDVWEYGEWEAV